MRTARTLVVGVLLAGAAFAVPVTAQPATPGWVPTLPTSQQSRQYLSAFADGTAYTFDVGGSAITLWHSGDYGLAWDALTYLPAGISTFAEARFATDKIGYLIDFDRLFRTADGATAPDWTQLPGPAVVKGHSYNAYALGVTGTTVSIGGADYGPLHVGCNTPTSVDVWSSHDAGRSWVTAKLPRDAYISQVRYVDARDGVALAYETKPDGNPCEYIGETNSVYVTHDGGRHFTNVLHCAAQPQEICTAAAFFNPRELFIGRTDGTMAISRDGGRSFHPGPDLPTLFGPQPTHSHNDDGFWIQGFASAGQMLYATTKLAGAYLSNDDGRTWTRENSCDSAFSLGIGEVAAFDYQRAIAGGPTCVATRTAANLPADSSPVVLPQEPATTAPGVDWTGAAGGTTVSISSGRLLLRR